MDVGTLSVDPERRRPTGSNAGGHPRQSSGVFSLFDTKQIQQFKEAFSMIDQNNDGIITEDDLKVMLTNLGKPPTASQLAAFSSSSLMPVSGSSGINFTQFLTMMGEHLAELDNERELVEAFECFDERDDGKIDASELRYWLGEVADRMSDKEIDKFLSGPFLDRQGNFNYREFVNTLRTNPEEEQ